MGEAFASTTLQPQPQAVQQDSTRLRHCSELVQHYYKNQQFDSLLIALKTGFALSKKLQTTRFHAELYLYYGLWYRSQKQADRSLKMFELAMTFGKRNDQPSLIERAGYGLAVQYADFAYQTGSAEAHRRCIKQIFENITLTNNKELPGTYLHHNYSLLASIYRENGNDSLAFFYLEKQQPCLKRLKDPVSQLWFLANAIEISLHKKNLQATHLHLNQLLQFNNQEKPTYSYVLLDVITQFVHFGKFNQAFTLIKVMRNTPKIMKALNSQSGILLYANLATIYIARKQYSLAEQAYDQAVILSKKDSIDFDNQLKLLVIQEKLLENQGQFKQALTLLKVIQQRKDSLAFNQSNSEIISLEENLRQEEKQTALRQQLKVEKLNQQLKTKELENLQLLQRIFLLIILIIVGILILGSYQFYRIRKQNSLIKKINARLNQMMAIIGHDLRSPITSLLVRLGQIAGTNEVIKNQIPAINNLLLTTDNLLYWAHGQKENPMKPFPQVVTLKEIIDEVLELYEISIEIAQINIQIEVNQQVIVHADENHLRIIVRNLVQNALNYTLSGGYIFLKTKISPHTINLIIENTDNRLEQNKVNRKKRGLGLGLKLVKELMHMNQGDLMIDHGAEIFKAELRFATVS